MTETPGEQPEGSHDETGKAGEAVQVERRDAAEHEQAEPTKQEEE